MERDGQVAIVTGASGGLGRVIALALAAQGASVVVAARTGAPLNAVATEIEALGHEALVVCCDVREPAATRQLVERTLAEWGRIDILVNAAGAALRRPALETTPDDWDTISDTLVKGTFLTTQAVLPTMIGARRGNIVNLGAPLAKITVPGFAAYTAAKFGVEGLTQTLAKELRRYGINVNAVHPGGFADTPMVRENVPELKSGLLDPAAIVPALLSLAMQPPRGVTGTTVDALVWSTEQAAAEV